MLGVYVTVPDRLLPQGAGPGVPGDRAAAAAGDLLRLPAVAGRRDGPPPARRLPGRPGAAQPAAERASSCGPSGGSRRRRSGRPATPGPTTSNCSPPCRAASSGSTRPARRATATELEDRVRPRPGPTPTASPASAACRSARAPTWSTRCRLSDRVEDRAASTATGPGVPRRAERGRLTLPVWVDHVGSAGTRYVTGDLDESPAARARRPQTGCRRSISPGVNRP